MKRLLTAVFIVIMLVVVALTTTAQDNGDVDTYFPVVRVPIGTLTVVATSTIVASPTTEATPTAIDTFTPTETPTPTATATFTATPTLMATPTNTPTETPIPTPEIVISQPRFQVFILNPVRTCLVGNDFASGTLCRGDNCGDCDCTWDEFDPPAPLSGVAPDDIDDPQYAGYLYKECVEITLSDDEITQIIDDMEAVRDEVLDWSGGALDLRLEFTELPHDHVGFVAPDFVFGPFEVDDELLQPFVSAQTDFVYVVNGVYDHDQDIHLAYMCGGSYGGLTIHGAQYANVQYNHDVCNSVTISGAELYEALLHEWMHNLDWALYHVNQVPDIYQDIWPDWEHWEPGDWPACNAGDPNTLLWFPSVDLCEWDPDWIDCTNTTSAGRCIHAGEIDGQISWYEHVIAAHYPRWVDYVGNHCRDGRQDFGETGIDEGGACPPSTTSRSKFPMISSQYFGERH